MSEWFFQVALPVVIVITLNTLRLSRRIDDMCKQLDSTKKKLTAL